jgi:AN1-type zinc finger protein 1
VSSLRSAPSSEALGRTPEADNIFAANPNTTMASHHHSDPSPARPREESFTEMHDDDLEAIGAHCQFPYCHQLDFLPFRCDSCHHTFCLDHRSETAHKCAHAGEWAKNRRKNSVGAATASLPATQKPTVLTATQCSEPKCKTLINTLQNTGVHCPNCNRQYCLKHRFREEHDCKNLVPLGARPSTTNSVAAQAEKVRSGFSRIRSWGSAKQEALRPKPKPTSRAAQMAALSKLKQTAKGDDKLPPEKRVYVQVEAEAATTTSKLPKAELFFSSEWSVGKVLDEAAKRLQVANVNNRVEDEEQRLRLYHVEGGRLLEFSEKFGQGVMSGNTVVLLRGVGPAVPDLVG